MKRSLKVSTKRSAGAPLKPHGRNGRLRVKLKTPLDVGSWPEELVDTQGRRLDCKATGTGGFRGNVRLITASDRLNYLAVRLQR
jgi:hypothetical protein